MCMQSCVCARLSVFVCVDVAGMHTGQILDIALAIRVLCNAICIDKPFFVVFILIRGFGSCK